MLLVIFLTGAILWNYPWSNYDNFVFVSAVEPGYLDFDNLPETNFSCEGKVIGGYYADIETGCQMFHVCTIGQKSEITDIKFLCLNGTVFDQETRVCERLDEVDCSRSESFFDLNLELYGNNGGGYGIQPEDDGKEFNEQTCEEEYDEEGDPCKKDGQKPDVAEHKDPEHSEWKESISTPVSKISSAPPITTAKPSVTTSTRPTSTITSKFLYHSELSIPSTTQDPGIQLLALHESFQQNLKQHDSQSKLRPFNAPPKNNSSIFSYSKTPLPYSTYQISSNTPQIKPSPFSPPLPSKLPNSLSNLSQNKNTLSNVLVNSNRTPPPFAVTYKPEMSNFYANKQHSQKVVTNRVTLMPAPSVPKQHQHVDTPVIYAYKILNTDGNGRPDRFGSTNFRYSLQASPVTAPGEAFKMESINSGHPAHSSFTIAQNRPHGFHPKTPHFYSAKDELDEYTEDDDELLGRQRQLQSKSDEYNSHSNFARAIADRPKNSSDPTAAISVILSTSSVSSSISSKLQSAISNNTNNDNKNPLPVLPSVNKNSFVQNNKNTNSLTSTLMASQPNITEINDSLTEESPYYDDANVEYDDNSPEYKDLLYPSDVQKIKQR